MKQLSDDDIKQMADSAFSPDTRAVNRDVRAQLKLGRLIPEPEMPTPRHARLDLHRLTEEQAWNAIMDVLQSGARRATIISGSSGILTPRFHHWARETIMAPYITAITPVNNGSFEITIARQKSD